MSDPTIVALKKCSECRTELPATTDYFAPTDPKRETSGFRNICRRCRNDVDRRAYQKDSFKKRKAQSGHYYEAKKAGLCPCCGGTPAPGGVYCAANRQGRLAYYKDYYRKSGMARRYGITFQQLEQMYEEQEGRCAICRSEYDWDQAVGRRGLAALVVDHCHETNKVRGLLCGHCNNGLGAFKDNIESLQAAMAYLQR